MSDNRNKKSIQRRPGPQNRTGKKPPLPSYKRGPFSWLIVAIVIFAAMMLLQQWQRIEHVGYDDFIEYLKNDQIESVEIGETEITGKFKTGIAGRDEKMPDSFTVDYKQEVVGERLTERLEESGVKWKFSKQHTWLWNLEG